MDHTGYGFVVLMGRSQEICSIHCHDNCLRLKEKRAKKQYD